MALFDEAITTKKEQIKNEKNRLKEEKIKQKQERKEAKLQEKDAAKEAKMEWKQAVKEQKTETLQEKLAYEELLKNTTEKINVIMKKFSDLVNSGENHYVEYDGDKVKNIIYKTENELLEGFYDGLYFSTEIVDSNKVKFGGFYYEEELSFYRNDRDYDVDATARCYSEVNADLNNKGNVKNIEVNENAFVDKWKGYGDINLAKGKAPENEKAVLFIEKIEEIKNKLENKQSQIME